MSHVPSDWIRGCTAAQRRLEAATQLVTDSVARRPSLLEGWSVGHVLNHLSRNADSHVGVFGAAARGEVGAQYPGGSEERARLIEEGSSRPAAALAANLREAHARLETAWASADQRAWESGLGLWTAGVASLAEFVFRRWREVEIHSLDLGLADLGGPDWSSVSQEYLDLETTITLRGLRARLPDGVAVHVIPANAPTYVIGSDPRPVRVQGSEREILKWLTGRGGKPEWPTLKPW
jgi:maleylpyruvate isomerase